MRPRLLLCDIDGTLVRSDKSLADPVVDAVRDLQTAGVPVSLISARPPSGILPLARRLNLSGPLGAFNGGTIFHGDGSIASADRLAPPTAMRALALIERPGIIKWLFDAGRWHAQRDEPAFASRERKSANQEPIIVGDFSELTGAVDKIVAVSDDHAMLADLEAEIAEALGDAATVTRSQAYYLDIMAPRANKGDGAAALARAWDVPLSNVVVIGDQRNDMAMFARAGFSIAMAQGPEEVRRAATRMTASDDDDGVAQAIETIILPMVRHR